MSVGKIGRAARLGKAARAFGLGSVAVFAVVGALRAATPEDEVMATDNAFHAASVARHEAGWGEFAAANAATEAATGRDAIVKTMAKAYAGPGFMLDWHPDYAKVFGDLAITSGPYSARSTSKEGKPQEEQGRYVTVWRHDHDGWKFVWDGDAGKQP